MSLCYPFQMLLAANQRNPLGVRSHHRWTPVSTQSESSCGSLGTPAGPCWSLLVPQSTTAQSGFKSGSRRRGGGCCRSLLPLLRRQRRGRGADSSRWRSGVRGSDGDAALCNDESDKIPGGGRSGGAAERRLHGDGQTRTERPRREPCALPSAGACCILSRHTLLFPGHVTPPAGCMIRPGHHVWSPRAEACGAGLCGAGRCGSALTGPVPPRRCAPPPGSVCLRVRSAPTPEVLRGN